MSISASLNLLVNLLRAVAAGLMFWRMQHAAAWQWALAALLVSAVAAVTSLVLVTAYYGRARFSARLLRDRTGEGTVFALSYSTGSIYDNVDKTLMGHYGMNAANGIYTMAYRVIDVACVPFGSIQLAASPRLFRKGMEGVRSTAAFAVRIVKRTGPAAVVTTLILLAAAPVIPYLAGNSFSESVSALRWLCLLPIFRCLHWSAGDALTGTGHQKLRLGTHSIAAAFNLVINLFLIPRFGWLGAAWASLATDGLLVILNWSVLWILQIRATSSLQQVS
jgi:O-antigen/teichoic acid export membrane protein